jgi:hypothetical protein
MRARLSALLATSLLLAAIPAHAGSGTPGASHLLVGVVEPVVGVAVSASGAVLRAGGTMDVTVTRVRYGATTIVTVIPR